ncbi:TPA: hypothetical protein H1008_01800 [archaeon]|nr:hypothetical protein [Candidatus Undinarchaeales archaeon SRR5007147.bin71]
MPAPNARELETQLRTIKKNTLNALNPETGIMDNKTIFEQGESLKTWLGEFETLYLNEASSKPSKTAKLKTEGEKILEFGWHCYEILVEADLQSGASSSPSRRWEPIEYGTVLGNLKEQIVSNLTKLENDYTIFIKTSLL